MQTWITDYDYYRSACNLDYKRLGANIYESIHILASLLECNDDLVTPKRSVSNHPNAVRWKGYEADLITYIAMHLLRWSQLYKIKDGSINMQNYQMICRRYNLCPSLDSTPDFVNDDLIDEHKQILIEKNPDYYLQIFYNGV